MRDVVKGAVKAVILIGVVLISLVFLNGFIQDKDNSAKYNGFYMEEGSFDVLFFGSSRMLHAVLPTELEQYGINAYNMAQHSERIRITYWQIKHAIEEKKPKVVVCDLSSFSSAPIMGFEQEHLAQLHKSIDHIPLSKLKYEAVNDILSEEVDRTEYLFPFILYHRRWNALKEEDFRKLDNGRKGADYRDFLEVQTREEWATEEIPDMPKEEAEYFWKIIELCREENVELVFTMMPAPVIRNSKPHCEMVNYFEFSCGQEGIDFLNFAKNDEFMDYETDFADDGHVNPSGSLKITEKVGWYLMEKYPDFGEGK